MATSTELVIRVVHILFGVCWAGASIALAGFIEPAVKAFGPQGGKFIQRLMDVGRFGMFMTLSSLAVVVSGIIMLWNGSGANLGAWFASGYGRMIMAGSIIGVIAFVVGLGFNATTAARIARISAEAESAGGPPPADKMALIMTLQKRLHVAGIASAVLLTLCVVAMAAAHFL